jgi:hypothetical protein
MRILLDLIVRRNDERAECKEYIVFFNVLQPQLETHSFCCFILFPTDDAVEEMSCWKSSGWMLISEFSSIRVSEYKLARHLVEIRILLGLSLLMSLSEIRSF